VIEVAVLGAGQEGRHLGAGVDECGAGREARVPDGYLAVRKDRYLYAFPIGVTALAFLPSDVRDF